MRLHSLFCERMRLVLLVVFAVFLVPRMATAQEAAPDSAVRVPVWKADLIGKLAATQAGYSNWAKGGVNSVAFSTGMDGRFERGGPVWQQKHDLRLGFGLVKQDTLEFRKAEDEISVSSSVQYRGGGVFQHLNPTFAFQTRTQFAPGYNFKKNPFNDEREPPVKVSDFFSPAIFTQSIGLTYDPADWFTQRLGVGSKQTVVAIPRFRELYGVPESGPALVEVGVESRTQVQREIVENVVLKSSLGLFAAFNKADVPDLTWENQVAMKVNSWLSVNVQVDALFDRDISNALQFKEIVTLGISYAII